MPEMKRRINYYKCWETDKDEAFRSSELKAVIAKVDEADYRHTVDETTEVGAIVSNDEFNEAIFLNLRGEGAPPVLVNGRLAAPNLKGEIAEPVHISVLARGIVGIEWNFYGPRPSRIAQYLMQFTDHELAFRPLLRERIESLDDLGMLRKAALSLPGHGIEAFSKEAGPLGSFFKRLKPFARGRFAFEWSAGRKRDEELSDTELVGAINAILASENYINELNALKVWVDEGGKQHEKDLIKTRISYDADVARVADRSSLPVSEEVFRAILTGARSIGAETLRDAMIGR